MIDARRFCDGLAYVLEACPSPTKDDDNLARVILADNLLVATDSHRFHVAVLPRDVDLGLHAVTKASAKRVSKALKGVAPPAGDKHPAAVTLDGLLLTYEDRHRDVEARHAFEPWRDAMPPRGWEPPEIGAAQALDLSRVAGYDSRHLAKATGWKNAVTSMRVDAKGVLRVDVQAWDAAGDRVLVAYAILRPATAPAAANDQQRTGTLFDLSGAAARRGVS